MNTTKHSIYSSLKEFCCEPNDLRHLEADEIKLVVCLLKYDNDTMYREMREIINGNPTVKFNHATAGLQKLLDDPSFGRDFPPEAFEDMGYRMIDAKNTHYRIGMSKGLRLLVTCLSDNPAWITALGHDIDKMDSPDRNVEAWLKRWNWQIPTTEAFNRFWDNTKPEDTDLSALDTIKAWNNHPENT